MKWLFLLFLFDTSFDGLKGKLRMTATFASEAECNKLGNDLASQMTYEDRNLKSFSTCIPQSEFAKSGLRTEKLD